MENNFDKAVQLVTARRLELVQAYDQDLIHHWEIMSRLNEFAAGIAAYGEFDKEKLIEALPKSIWSY